MPYPKNQASENMEKTFSTTACAEQGECRKMIMHSYRKASEYFIRQ